jgi:phosphoglycerate dehydrogenase-like enzyme
VYYPDQAELKAYVGPLRASPGTVVHTASTPEGAARVIGEIEVLYAWGFPRHLLRRASRLRWVQAMGAGVDRFLVPELLPRGVPPRAPVFGAWMVEYVFGWLASITQKMEAYRQAQREHRWIETFPDRLRGKTLTLLGLGDIGRALARAAAAYGIRVVGLSRSGRPVPHVDRVYRRGGLLRALGEADYAVVAVPLTAETRGLIGAKELRAMRPHAWLVNIARGPVIKEAALIAALREQRIAGAILDVFEEEPLPPEHPLWDLPTVVITPHIAGPSTPAEITPVFNENLRRYAARRPFLHAVDRRRGY